jgi:hypothetical protein
MIRSRFTFTPGLGREKLCTRCLEWWPADREFFYRQHNVRCHLSASCRACILDYKNARKQQRRAV